MNTTSDPTPQPPVDATPVVGDNSPQLESVAKITQPLTPSQPQKGSPMKRPTPVLIALMIFVPVIAGVVTGFGLQQLQARGGSSSSGNSAEPMAQVPSNGVKAGDVFGSSADEFKDQAQGVVVAGGFDGEGSHQLRRPGGESQTVYLTSSITDLSKFENMEIKIWGETFKGQKVGWLMDVGRVEVLNTKAEVPE